MNTRMQIVKAALIALAAVVLAQPASAQHMATPARAANKSEMKMGARISKDSAKVVALAQVPGGKVKEVELEKEDGSLIYSFDIKVAGKRGIEEVHVDAMTGAMLKTEHETRKAEKKEAKAEAKEKSDKKAAMKKP